MTWNVYFKTYGHFGHKHIPLTIKTGLLNLVFRKEAHTFIQEEEEKKQEQKKKIGQFSKQSAINA